MSKGIFRLGWADGAQPFDSVAMLKGCEWTELEAVSLPGGLWGIGEFVPFERQEKENA